MGDSSITFSKAMTAFKNGEYKQSYVLLHELAEQYEHVPILEYNAETLLYMYVSYETITSIVGKKNAYIYKLMDEGTCSLISSELLNHIKFILCHHYLINTQYLKAFPYMKYLQVVTGPNVSPETMSYFNLNDENKTLLIYNSGGIGDIIMFSRFIWKISESQSKNKIIYVVNDEIHWIFNEAFSINKLSNLKLVSFSHFKQHPIPFDYHTNITLLFGHLKLDYNEIFTKYYLEHVSGNPLPIYKYIKPDKKNIVINWSGNKLNIMEKFNRSIPLANFIPIINKYQHVIHFMSIQKSLSDDESLILKATNVSNYGPSLDTNENVYKDTLTLLKHVDLVITTDTSLVHVAGTMNIPCWCILTIGCEWRWRHPCNSYWYPNVKTFRQTEVCSWTNVISELMASIDLLIQQI